MTRFTSYFVPGFFALSLALACNITYGKVAAALLAAAPVVGYVLQQVARLYYDARTLPEILNHPDSGLLQPYQEFADRPGRSVCRAMIIAHWEDFVARSGSVTDRHRYRLDSDGRFTCSLLAVVVACLLVSIQLVLLLVLAGFSLCDTVTTHCVAAAVPCVMEAFCCLPFLVVLVVGVRLHQLHKRMRCSCGLLRHPWEAYLRSSTIWQVHR
jgi:hypothetical protein